MSADKKNKLKSIALQLCALGVTVVAVGLGYFYATPKSYRAVVKVEVSKKGYYSFGQDQLPRECETARSDAILGRVITNLSLPAIWGNKLGQGSPLTIDQTRERLKEILRVFPATNSLMIIIAATGSDPIEPAKIVNEIARLYTGLRQTERERASIEGFDSLRAQSEKKSKEVQEAEATVRKMWIEYNHERTNHPVYDRDALEGLQSQSAALEDDYQTKSNQLARLQALDRADLRKFFSTNEADFNPLLASTLERLAKAKANLDEARAAHGDNAPETKSARVVVAELNRQIDRQTDSMLSMRQLDLVSLKAAAEQIKQISVNAAHATNDPARISAQDEAYAKAKTNLDILTRERDDLNRKIAEKQGFVAAALPDAITAKIVELAEPPAEPFSPDKKIATGAFIAGGAIAGLGLLLLALLNTKPRGAEKKTA
jgi:uncharacterized protein involved in exopolysaccharide biosynthesis